MKSFLFRSLTYFETHFSPFLLFFWIVWIVQFLKSYLLPATLAFLYYMDLWSVSLCAVITLFLVSVTSRTLHVYIYLPTLYPFLLLLYIHYKMLWEICCYLLMISLYLPTWAKGCFSFIYAVSYWDVNYFHPI